MGTAGQDRADELTAGVDTTCTGVSGILRTVASCAAHRAATLDDGETVNPDQDSRMCWATGHSLCLP
jgi:hypothetical protein